MTIVRTALNRLMTEDRIVNHPILSWSLHDLPHNVRMLKKAVSARPQQAKRRGVRFGTLSL